MRTFILLISYLTTYGNVILNGPNRYILDYEPFTLTCEGSITPDGESASFTIQKKAISVRLYNNICYKVYGGEGLKCSETGDCHCFSNKSFSIVYNGTFKEPTVVFICEMSLNMTRTLTNKTVINAVPISTADLTPNRIEVAVGSNQTVNCTTDAGRPNARMQWYLSDGTNLTTLATQQPDCEPGCNNTVISISQMMFTGRMEYHQKSLYCIARNLDDRFVKSDNVTIDILYGPSAVSLFPSTINYTVKEGASVSQINCSAACRPECTIEWSGPNLPAGVTSVLHLQNINRSQTGDYHCTASNNYGYMQSMKVKIIVSYGPAVVVLFPPEINYTVKEGANVGQINCSAACRPDCIMTWNGPNLPVDTTSILHLQNMNRNQTGDYQCTARNDIGTKLSSKVKVIVNYGPNVTVLSPSTNNYTVTEGDSIGEIHCSADCRPNCTKKWSGPSLPDGTTSVLHLQDIDRNQAGEYQCIANNSVWSLSSSKVIVVVLFGPRAVILSPDNLYYTVTEAIESIGPINCTVHCKPDCTMIWSGPNLHGDKTSVLNLPNISRNSSGEYQCTASNSVGNNTSGIMKVFVEYGPNAVLITPSNASYTVKETTDNVGPVTCSSDCVPECILAWIGPNLYANSSSILLLQNVSRTQTGDYHCLAANNVGSLISRVVSLFVNYIPTITSIEGNTTFIENDTAVFRCNVDSSPKSSINWKFIDGSSIIMLSEKNQDMYKVDGNLLIVEQMNCLSMGFYSCEANNGIGETQMNINVVVKCSPRLNNIEYEIESLIVVGDNQLLNITAPILAYPNPRIFWQFVNNSSKSNITSNVDNTYNSNRHFSTLLIENMTRNDLGFYAIYAGNGIGMNKNYIGIYEVQAARRPNKPTNITCSEGQNYIIVNWKPEFNGGSLQSFIVFYKRVTEKLFKAHPEQISEHDYYPVKISSLISSGVYLLKVYAVNIYNTTVSDEIYCNTTANEESTARSFVLVGVGAGIGSAVVILCVVFTSIFVLRRIRKKMPRKDKESIKLSNEEEENDGLKDNPLYVSSADDVHQSAMYSKGSKEKKTEIFSTSPKKKKINGKGNTLIEMACVYENHDILMKPADQTYANQQDSGNISQVYSPKKNKDGLIYADLDLAPVSSDRRFIIRGIENTNNYAIIDMNKKADPLPSDDEDEENDGE